MASFPGSVKTFATRSAGQTINAAHVNDLQDEVTAIEDALINGGLNATLNGLTLGSTARLNVGGPSTLGTLQAGASTFTGDVVMSGALTVAGVPVGVRLPTAKVVHSADQAVANGTWTGLSWDTELHDSTALHDTASNSSRIALTSSGVWMIGGQVCWRVASTAGDRYARIRLDDSTSIGAGLMAVGVASTVAIVSFQTLYLATDTTHYVTVQVYQNSGSTGSVSGIEGSTTTDFGRTQFWVQKMSV